MVRVDEAGWTLPEGIRERVLRAVSPNAGERSRIEEASSALVKAVERKALEMGLDSVRCVLSGSVAKGTYMKDPDLDVFILFKQGTDLETLKSKGLSVASSVLTSPKMNYAQHPYMTGRFMGLNADIVPGIDIPEGARVVTAVDRTQHHTRYLNSRAGPHFAREVLLLKAFLKGIGAYGAEDTANGISGYLAELFVLWNGSFDGVVRWLASIEVARVPPTDREEIGIEHLRPGPIGPIAFGEGALMMDPPLQADEYVRRFGKDALVVIDPTDRERNVASPVSAQTLAHTASCASALIASPTDGMFFPFSTRPHDLSRLGPGTLDDAFVLDLPEGNPSRVVSQLRRSLTNLSGALRREGFDSAAVTFILAFHSGSDIDPAYLKSRAAWVGDVDRDAVLFWARTEPPVLPRAYRHWGPPEDNRQATDFRAKWKDRAVRSENGRLYVDLVRTRTDPSRTVSDLWAALGHGPDIASRPVKRYGSGA